MLEGVQVCDLFVGPALLVARARALCVVCVLLIAVLAFCRKTLACIRLLQFSTKVSCAVVQVLCWPHVLCSSLSCLPLCVRAV